MPEHMTPAEATRMTRDILTEHGLGHWKIVFDNKARTAGWCNHGITTIGYSKKLLAARPYMDSRNTVLHELAHALVGPRHGHNVIWQRKCLELGGDGKQKHNFVNPEAPWMARCEHGCVCDFHRKPTRRYRCRKHRLPMVLEDNRKATRVAAQRQEMQGDRS